MRPMSDERGGSSRKKVGKETKVGQGNIKSQLNDIYIYGQDTENNV